jgi:hypothetical protein
MSVTKKQVDLVQQTILTSIPIVIPQIYAFHKIKKTKQGSLIFGILWGLPIYLTTYFTFHNSTLYSDPELVVLVNNIVFALLNLFFDLLYPPMI